MDFYKIIKKPMKFDKEEGFEVYPDFIVKPSQDLMIRGGGFYAIWDEENEVWSLNEYDVARLVDQELKDFAENLGTPYLIKDMTSFGSKTWMRFKQYISSIANSFHELDANITFANDIVKKEDYVSKRLGYSLAPGDHSGWDDLLDVLYAPDERAKIEWAIGAVVAGDSREIQKFLVFYGKPGTGKSTVLNIIHKMFYEYTTVFEAKALGSANNNFATEVFQSNPLVAIQHDGDLSRIEDNTKLNSIIAHEEMLINQKFKPGYMARVNAFLFMGTNQPVKISDARSGIIRRLIDVNPTGDKIPSGQYQALLKKIEFEYGAIAQHCLDVYKRMGKHYYDGYRPTDMMYKTDNFFNFVEAHYNVFNAEAGISLKRAWALYKDYVNEAMLPYSLSMNKFREELKDYFKEFEHRAVIDGEVVSSYFRGFDASKFNTFQPKQEIIPVEIPKIVLDQTESLLDKVLADQPAQGYRVDENGDKVPAKKWENVATTLKDINTSRLHFVKIPENHIVIDFDIKDETGEKNLEKNIEAASLWPSTYAELSQGGSGIHLHYIFDGDVTGLSSRYEDGIEVKTLLGDASLRRRVSKCNSHPIATINSGLPLKEKNVLSTDTIKSERGLRDLVIRNLRKEIHPGTKPSIDFIYKILNDAYESGMKYDLTDMKSKVISFAMNSTNKADYCLKLVQQMKFASEEQDSFGDDPVPAKDGESDAPIAFYDVEVYPNLFVVCWKYQGADDVTKMINPSAQDIENLFKLRLVGFNNRRYDNHILWGRYMGMSVEQLYHLSQQIIEKKNHNAMFGEAYNLSYADIYDFASEKKGLKKWMIELGMHHMEMDIPWDQPVPDDKTDQVVEYCCNDVLGTEAVFEARIADFTAREILAELSGLSVNDTTNRHSTKIIFGHEKNPQSQFVYTDLSTEFPGYTFVPTRSPKSDYRGEDPSEGGYVYAEPGMYENVAVLDVSSMHPSSIIALNLFGDEYTAKFKDLLDTRIAIKHKDFDLARQMLDGRLKPYLKDESKAKELAYALKIVINSVYGLTSASFDNPFRDRRNKDNIVAKRGALFMIDLKHFVQERGFTVAHIKTDSIKIPNATPEIIKEVIQFGEKYGYSFEHEATYEKFCLVNDAVYIACETEDNQQHWTAVGAQFQHPYVYKTLFTGGVPTFDDLCETKQVQQGAMYLDFEHDRPEPSLDRMQFIGRTGRFIPVESGGAVLYRVKDDKFYAVAGTKGYLWLESEMYEKLDDKPPIDMSYFHKLVDEAKKNIEKFGSYDEFMAPF